MVEGLGSKGLKVYGLGAKGLEVWGLGFRRAGSGFEFCGLA